MGDTLLSYAVSSNPDPLQASPQTGDPSPATLIIVVSNDTHKLVQCRSISFGFLQGGDAKDFFSDATGIGTSAPTGWTITQDGSLFTATPDTSQDGQVGKAGLTFTLSNIKVNEQVGTTPLTVTEVTASNNGTLDISLYKFPLEFTLDDLQGMPPPPIAPGGSVTLSWNGMSENTTYELQYEDADGNTVTISHPKGEHDQPLPSMGSYTIDNVQKETTFYLIVTLQLPGHNKPLVAEKFFPVTLTQLQPEIAFFEGHADLSSYPWHLILRWDTHYAKYCEISDDAYQLKPSSTDAGYKKEWQRGYPPTASYTLTAVNDVGSVTSPSVTVDWQLQLITSVSWPGCIRAMAVAPDGNHIYVADNNNAKICDALTLQHTGDFFMPTGHGPIEAMSITTTGNFWHIAIACYDGTIVLADYNYPLLGGGSMFFKFMPMGIAYTPDGDHLYVLTMRADQGDPPPGTPWGDLSLISQWAPTPINSIPINSPTTPQSLTLSPDATRLYVSTQTDLGIYDAGTLQPIGNPVPAKYTGRVDIAASADTFIYAANYNGIPLSVLDATTLQPTHEQVPAVQGVGTKVAVSPDGMRVYLASGPDNIGNSTLTLFSRVSVTGGQQPA